MPTQPTPDAGLARRVEREAARISSQHRQLDDFHAVVRDAVERGDLPAARMAFQRFADAVEAHVSLEDEFYFPALHGLAEELGPQLSALSDEHRVLRARMEGVAEALRGQSAPAAAEALAAWIAEVTAHERREEELLARAQRVRGARDA